MEGLQPPPLPSEALPLADEAVGVVAVVGAVGAGGAFLDGMHLTRRWTTTKAPRLRWIARWKLIRRLLTRSLA